MSRREVLKVIGVGGGAGLAGCYANPETQSAPLPAVGGGGEVSITTKLGAWDVAIASNIEAAEYDTDPALAFLIDSGEVAVFGAEGGESTRHGALTLTIEKTIDDVEVDTYPTITFLLGSHETVVFSENTSANSGEASNLVAIIANEIANAKVNSRPALVGATKDNELAVYND